MKGTGRKIAVLAASLTLALALSYAETLIPLPVPGAKLGFANLIVLFLLLRRGAREAAAVSFARVVLFALLFGGSGFLMSISGAAASFSVMLALRRSSLVSPVGVSIAGAAAHITAQVAAAALMTASAAVFTFLPVLLLISLVTGGLNGVIYCHVLAKIPLSKDNKSNGTAGKIK